jgi:hypothetical protein
MYEVGCECFAAHVCLLIRLTSYFKAGAGPVQFWECILLSFRFQESGSCVNEIGMGIFFFYAERKASPFQSRGLA